MGMVLWRCACAFSWWLLLGACAAGRVVAPLPVEARSLETRAVETPPAEPAAVETPPAESAVAEAPEVDARPRAWLYRVRRAETAPSYVLGTMHVGVAFPRALPPPLDSTLYAARTLVMEIDLREAARFFRTAPRVRRARSRWIDRTLPRATWSRLTAELSAVASPEEIARMPPGLMAIYMRHVRMAEVEAADDGWERIPGTASPTHLDRWIFDWAVSWEMPVVALETPEEAVAALSTYVHGNALDTLRAVIDDADGARAEARRLREAYLSLDEAQVLAVLSDMSVEERHATFIVRNRAWLRNLLPVLDAGGAFIAVGLAHLLGEESLLALLRERGYEVERVLGDGGIAPTEGAADRVWIHAPPRRPY